VASVVRRLRDNKNEGLLLAKTGPTNNNASAGATINGVRGDVLTEVGFDIRNGTHCGAGAPRFNIVVEGSPSEIRWPLSNSLGSLLDIRDRSVKSGERPSNAGGLHLHRSREAGQASPGSGKVSWVSNGRSSFVTGVPPLVIR